jgi:hypothetical protein
MCLYVRRSNSRQDEGPVARGAREHFLAAPRHDGYNTGSAVAYPRSLTRPNAVLCRPLFAELSLTFAIPRSDLITTLTQRSGLPYFL